jgi:GTPase SAR1 family protein
MELLLVGVENSGKSYLMKCLRKKFKTLGEDDLILHEIDSYADRTNTKNIVSEGGGSKKPFISFCPDEGTTSTVGVDIVDFTLENKHFKITELGGTTFSRWFSYYENCNGIIFVIDMSNMGTWPNAMVALPETISYEDQLSEKPMLLLLNKKDACDSMTFKTGENLLNINEIVLERKNTTVIGGSSFDSVFIDKVADWIRNLIKGT